MDAAKPYSVADLRRMADLSPHNRVAATLLSIIDRLAPEERYDALEGHIAQDAELEAGALRYRWIDPRQECHDCERLDTRECQRCNDVYCPEHQLGHAFACWSRP